MRITRIARKGRTTLPRKGEEGFTLVELMIITFIMVLILIGIGSMISSGVKSSSASFSLVKITEGANEALSTMVRQIRVASSLDQACTTSAIAFTGDIDGVLPEETVRFDAAGGYLRRGSSVNDMMNWIPNVSSITFTYYYFDPVTKSMTALTPGTVAWTNNRTLINRIDITLVMSATSAGLSMNRDYTASVNLRNALR